MKTEKKPFPKYLSIQTTSLCNASCVFCPYPELDSLFPAKTMDAALYKKIIDECSGYKEVERIILYMNNEPLTDKYIIERINYAKEKMPGVGVHLLTNGILLDDKTADQLINSRLDWLGISFHGIRKETIEKTMGISYDLAFSRINNFIEKVRKKKNLKKYLMVTLLKHKYLTESEKDEAIKFWKSKGIERISYFKKPISRAGNIKRLPKIYNQGKITGCNSIWADEMMHIVENGKVVLCCMDWKREVILGDLNSQTVKEVWQGERKKIWEMIQGQSQMPYNFLCRRCEEAALGEPARLVKTVSQKYNVLLINLPPWGVDNPPLAAACLSSYLQARNIEVDIFDMNIELFNSSPAKDRHLWSMNYSHLWRQEKDYLKIRRLLDSQINSLMGKIVKSDKKIVGFSLPTNCSLFILKEVAEKIKNSGSGKIIIAGGGSVSIKEQREELDQVAGQFIDYYVAGEGEEALYKIVERLNQKSPTEIESLEGVFTKKGIKGCRLAQIKDLNSLPYPSFDNFDLKKYQAPESLPMEFSRGCVGRCTYCAFKTVSPSFRIKSASYLFGEIRFHQQKYGMKHVSFSDAAINGNPAVLEELCDLLIKEKVTVRMSALAIPRREMTLSLLKKMRRAGFYRLEYGAESGSDRVLGLMRKIFTAEIAQRVIKNSYEAGIKVYLYFIVGYPGELKEDFLKTREFLKKVAPFVTMIKSINPLYVMAGSELFCLPEKYGINFSEKNRDMNWSTKDNTVDVRKRRVEELKSYANQLKIPFTEEGEHLEFTGFLHNKKCEILFINLPPWAQDNPHIGIGYLCSYLRKRGALPKVVDLNKRFFLNYSEYKMLWHVENKNFWSNPDTYPLIAEIFKEGINQAVSEVVRAKPLLVGVSVVDPKERLAIDFIKRIKRRLSDSKIILGGPAVSTAKQRQIFLDQAGKDIDLFVIGEGEERCYEVVNRVKQKKSLEKINGTIVKTADGWEETLLKPNKTIEQIPFPTYQEFDMESYGKSLLVEWSRGCHNRCSFCKNWRLFPFYRAKVPEKVLDELKYQINIYGIRKFTVVDSILNGNPDNLYRICSLIIDNDLGIEWSGQIAPSEKMNYSFFKHMHQAGCRQLQIGVESADNRVLKRMRKSYTAQMSQKTIRNAKKAGIKTEIFIIIGFPGENQSAFKKTFDFVKKNRAYIDTIKSINTLHLVAGTEVYERSQDFKMKPLPDKQWHFLWETYDGNNYGIRKKRAEKLLELAETLGIKVMEANTREGKEEAAKKAMSACNNRKQLKKVFKNEINRLQPLPEELKKQKRKRSILKWSLLLILYFYTLVYIIYFWIYMCLHGKVLLGGEVKNQ
jgi:radical SAM superfamily enzyme YgiQ (UPF0313 family)/sulfatase maturation enzyme AslB (radical SAM superfamily)